MLAHRKRRLFSILAVICGVSVALGLALYALKQNINLYFTPTQLVAAKLHKNQIIRLGGLVVKNSVRHEAGTLKMQFVVTDFQHSQPVFYEGVLPSLFREGQGIVVQGSLNEKGIFVAQEVLAKHDENYHPPEINLKEAQ